MLLCAASGPHLTGWQRRPVRSPSAARLLPTGTGQAAGEPAAATRRGAWLQREEPGRGAPEPRSTT